MASGKKISNINDATDIRRLEEIILEILENSLGYSMINHNTPFIMSFSITLDANGRPRIRSLQNIDSLYQQRLNKNKYLFEVIETENNSTIVLELHNTKPEEIGIRVSGSKVLLTIASPTPFYKLVELKNIVKHEPARKSFNNGILEITFEKAEEEK